MGIRLWRAPAKPARLAIQVISGGWLILSQVLLVGAQDRPSPPSPTPPGDVRAVLELIANANANAIERIDTIDGEYVRRRWTVGRDGKRKPMDDALRVWWWYARPKHRLKYFLEANGATDAKRSGFVDQLLGETESKVLSNYDWPKSPPIALGKHKESGIYGEIAHRSGEAFYQVNPLIDLCIQLQVTPVASTLGELLRAVNYKAELQEVSVQREDDVSPHLAYEVRLRLPEDGRAMRVTVDPAVNYMICGYTIAPTKDSAAQGGGECTWQVKHFTTALRNAWLPDHVLVSIRAEPGLSDEYQVELTFEQLAVNQPVGEEAFDFRFPANAAVNDRIRDVVHVWGAANEPAHTVRSLEEDRQIAKDLGLLGGKGELPAQGWNLLFWGNVIVVVALLVVIVFRLTQRTTTSIRKP